MPLNPTVPPAYNFSAGFQICGAREISFPLSSPLHSMSLTLHCPHFNFQCFKKQEIRIAPSNDGHYTNQDMFFVIMNWIRFVKCDIKEQFSNFMEESPIVQYWDFAFESGPQGLVSVPTAYFCKTSPCMYILSEKMILVFTYRTYFCSVIHCTRCSKNVVGYCWLCVPSMRLLSLLVVGVVVMLFTFSFTL